MSPKPKSNLKYKPKPNPISWNTEDTSPVPDLTEIPALKKISAKLSGLIEERQYYSEKIKEAETSKRAIDASLLKLLLDKDVRRVRISGFATCITRSKTRKLDPVLLVEGGVDPELIDRCTIIKEGKEHLRVVPPKDAKDDSDSDSEEDE